MESLDHPFKREIEALRRIILGVHPSIAEGIKWNAPSFRTSEYFATFHLRARDGVAIILHLGAKVRGRSHPGIQVEDPSGLLTWLAKDRAMVVFEDAKDVKARRAALEAVLRHWIASV